MTTFPAGPPLQPARRPRPVEPEAFLRRAGRRTPGRRRVAVLTPHLDRWYFGSVLAGIERIVHEAGHDVMVHQLGDHWVRQAALRGSPGRTGVDAVIAVAVPVTGDVVRSWESDGLPVVVAQVGQAECVHVNDVKAGRLATEHLTRLGHRRIALVRTCDENGRVWQADLDRTDGYLQALALAGIRYDDRLVLTVPFGPRGGAAAAQRLMALPDPPTGIFTTCDEVAFGVLPSLAARGVTVPAQVSVVSVDDHPLAEVVGLSTVDQRVEVQGELAGRLVLDALLGLRQPAASEPHEVELKVRGRRTSGPAGPTSLSR